MIGFKRIDELSLEECSAFLKKETPESNKYFEDVSAQYEKLVEQVKGQEEKDYRSCRTIGDFASFISKYSTMPPAYEPSRLDDARKAKAQLEDKAAEEAEARRQREQREAAERRRKRKIIIASVFGTLLVAAVVTFFIGYCPVKTLSVEDVTFGKEGGEMIIRIETNVGPDAIDLIEPKKDWVSVAKESKKLTITAIANPDPERTCTMLIEAYTTFFGDRIGTPIKKEVVIRQNSGYATRLNVNSHSFSIDKYSSSKQVNVKTDGVALELAANVSWIHIKEKSRNHDGNFYHNDDYEILIEKNPTGQRDGKVVVTAAGQPQQEILISQASGLATRISVSPQKIHCNEADGLSDGLYYKVDFSTDGTTWKISKPYWVDVEQVINEKGVGYLKVIPGYNDGSFRDGKIIVSSNNGHTKEINVSQEGGPSNLYAATSVWRPGVSSDTKTIGINNDSHYPLRVSSDQSWLSASVSGNNVTLKCTSTSSGYQEPRKGTVTVTCRNASCSISVKQDGYKECDKCRGSGKCRGGNALGQHAWQTYGVIGQHWEPYSYGITGGYWMTDYGWTWQYCSVCGGSGKCNKCDGKGKIVSSY